jgi:hypothetical protein
MRFGSQVANEPWNATEWYQLPDQLLTPSTAEANWQRAGAIGSGDRTKRCRKGQNQAESMGGRVDL